MLQSVVSAILIVPAVVVLVVYAALAAATLILAEITRWRQATHQSSSSSAVYVGRVSHTRMLPIKHSFSYPIFIACVDLEEDFQDQLWPLSSCMALRPSDHYKNNEGKRGSLLNRTFELVKEKTNGKCAPTLETHRVKLLTHLCYYGYCFNPVSFYYVLNRNNANKIDAIVAEVSNTPWNEMQCYVLHKDSIDMREVKPGRAKQQLQGTNYVFPKTFHVSPFMDMEHTYDWTFWEIASDKGPICVTTSMMKDSNMYFNAYLEVNNNGLHPHRLAWQLISFPVFCFIIQLWIHYEAFWLFVKGVAYVPHPEDSETAASRVIGNMMIPFFALKEWWDTTTERAKVA